MPILGASGLTWGVHSLIIHLTAKDAILYRVLNSPQGKDFHFSQTGTEMNLENTELPTAQER